MNEQNDVENDAWKFVRKRGQKVGEKEDASRVTKGFVERVYIVQRRSTEKARPCKK